MCTSHVADNTQRLVSMGKQCKRWAMMVINAIARDDKDVVEVTALDDDESLAKMSGGDVDVESYLYSRNTIGHGNHNPKSQRPKHVKIVIGGNGERRWCLRKAVVVCGSMHGHRGKIWRN